MSDHFHIGISGKHVVMTGNEFLKKLKKVAKKRGFQCKFENERGKGSHGTVYFGDKRAILKDRKKELGPGLLSAMCAQLGISVDELNKG